MLGSLLNFALSAAGIVVAGIFLTRFANAWPGRLGLLRPSRTGAGEKDEGKQQERGHVLRIIAMHDAANASGRGGAAMA